MSERSGMMPVVLVVALLVMGFAARLTFVTLTGGIDVAHEHPPHEFTSDDAELERRVRSIRETVGISDQPRPTSGAIADGAAEGTSEDDAVHASGAVTQSPGSRELYELYAEYGRVAEYRKLMDRLPTRPLALPLRDYVEALAQRPGELVPSEDVGRVQARLSALNAQYENPIREGGFTVLCLGIDNEIWATLGLDSTPRFTDPSQSAAQLVAQARAEHGKAGDGRVIPAGANRNLRDLIAGLPQEREQRRRALWREIEAAIGANRDRRTLPDELAGFFVRDGTAYLVRRGQDAELDRTLEELTRERRRVRAVVTGMFR